MNKKFFVFFFMAITMMLVFGAGQALAGTGGTGMFDNIYHDISSWTTGYLGRIFAIMALLVGIGGGVKGNYTALFGGIGVGAAAMYGPNILDSIVTALM